MHRSTPALPRSTLFFALACLGFTFIGNFPRLTTYQSNLNWLKYVYAPLGFWQGWTMYSQNLDEVAPIRYRYDHDGTSTYVVSPYGHTPNATPTLLGNFDVRLSYGTSAVVLPVLAYYCIHPQSGAGTVHPVRVALESQRRTTISIYKPDIPSQVNPFREVFSLTCPVK